MTPAWTRRSPMRSRRLTIDANETRPASKNTDAKVPRCVSDRQPVFRPMERSCNTSATVVSRSEPLMDISLLLDETRGRVGIVPDDLLEIEDVRVHGADD